jgi:hypothetical protein
MNTDRPKYRRFSQGWLLYHKDIHRPFISRRATRSWIERKVGDYTLVHEPNARYYYGRSANSAVHAIGIIMNVFDFSLNEQQICASLSQDISRGGWEDFYLGLKALAGAHIIFVEHGGVSVVLDATGTVPAVHGRFRNTTVVASHPRLVAQINSACISSVAREWSRHPAVGRGGPYMSGLLTSLRELI